jgi:nucleoside-diphosphate-sugar epimerase
LKKIFTGLLGFNLLGLNLIGPSFQMVYAGDVGKAAVLALQKEEESIGKAYNLVSEQKIKLAELRKLWIEAGGPLSKLTLPLWLPFHGSDTLVSIERAKNELDWCNISLQEGLKETFQLENKGK